MGTITVKNLYKAYKQYPSLNLRLREWLSFGYKTYHQLRWVLNDINFHIESGEAVGLVGMNGAGKSTLLKLITGTARPSSGSIETSGKVSALLELGLGFHPEFTGRQNIYISGQLLGFQNKEIVELMPEIEAFAEIGSYIDQPLRTYSSGMQVRLAFSLATVTQPDLLIVDEALSVGDAYFQHKCFKRIRELREKGTTLLFVSHDNGAVAALCDRAILLHHGYLALEDKPPIVLDYYNALLADMEGKNTQQIPSQGTMQTISGTQEATLISIQLFNTNNESVNIINVAEEVKLHMVVKANTHLKKLILGYQIKDHLGQTIFGTNTHHLNHRLTNISAEEIIEFDFLFKANMGAGSYSVSIALHADDTHHEKNYEWRDLALIFKVINLDKNRFIGTSWLPPKLKCSRELTPAEI